MEDTVIRPAVDLQPRRTHAGLALVLALLSVPGSTIAWDLPAGGLWIGLPLAVAAILLGTRSHRRHGRSWMATAAIAIASLMLGLMVVWTLVSLAT